MKCPFRTCKQEHPAMLRGHGAVITEDFYDCNGEECAAFHDGICLRLNPREYTIRATLTDKELQALKNDLMRAVNLMPHNPEHESIVATTHLYGGEMIFSDWHDRLSHLEFIYNPGDDGPWYRADDVWACIDPAKHKEAVK